MINTIIYMDKYNSLLGAEPFPRLNLKVPKLGENCTLYGKEYTVLLVTKDIEDKSVTITLDEI